MRRRLPACMLLLGLACAGSAAALTLQQAYQAALAADPKYQADRHERDAGLYAVPLARAALLPTLSLSASQLRYDGRREVPTAIGPVSQDLNYTAPQQALNLRLPLYNAENLRRYEQAQLQAGYSEQVFLTREAELADRLATAYLRVLLAGEELRLAQAQEQAFGAQALSAERRLDRGEGTRVEIVETAARLDIARAQRIDAEDALAVARIDLHNIVGQDPGLLSGLQPDFAPPVLEPAALEAWLDRALADNPALAARRQAVAVAEAEVAKSRAGHLPRLDLVAGITRSRSESVSTLDQKLSQRFIGVQLNVPLYAGGYVSALTEQAAAQLRRTQAELDLERATLEANLRRAFLAASHAQARVAAHARAVAASGAALEATRRGLAAGLRTNVEVLEAQRLLFTTRRDLAQARHEYLLARLRLHSGAGLPAAQVVEALSALLSAQQ